MTEKQYDQLVKELSPNSPAWRDCLWAFCVGGGICVLGQTFLVVEAAGEKLVAADQVGAGVGDKVLLATGTVAARFCMDAPVDAAVVAILDPEAKYERT